MRKGILVSIICVFAVILLFGSIGEFVLGSFPPSPPSPTPPPAEALSPVADTFFDDSDNFPNGWEGSLWVGHDDVSGDRRSALKFDTSSYIGIGLGEVAEATLWIYVEGVNEDPTAPPLDVWGSYDHYWPETTTTPPPQDELVDTLIISNENTPNWYSFDVTDYVNNQIEQGFASFVLEISSNSSLLWFPERSNANHSRLAIKMVYDLPTVMTASPTSVSTTSATLGGNVTDDGGDAVTERGIVYSTSPSPTVDDNKVQIGSGTGSFSQSVSGFSSGTTYYVRAYATNSAGTAYGTQQSFTTAVSVTSIVRYDPSSALTNSNQVVFQINLSGPVSGLSISNFSITTSGGISGPSWGGISGSGSTYYVTYNTGTGTGSGNLRLNLSNSTGVTPSVINVPYFNGETYSIDKTPPTVSITSDETSPTNANPIPVKINFSKSVTGFVVGDITVSGGTLSNFSGSGSNYTVDVTPSSDGTITLDIAAGVAQDEAGNDNTAASQFNIVYDITSPTVSITSDETGLTNANPIPVKIDFSESVTGFVVGDITVSGGTLSNFSGSGANYTVDVTPSSDGTITLDIAAGVAQDEAGNDNTAASQFSIEYDGTAPTVAISSDETSPTNATIIPVKIDFSKSVSGFGVGDITISGGTLSNLAGSGESYTVDVTPFSDGTITMDIAAGVVQDAAGNDNEAATQFSIVSDRTAPTVVITSDEISPTNANPIPIKIDFSEAVTGFVIGDITVAGGTLSNLAGSGANYTVDLTPLGDGTITMDIAARVAQDAAGNDNEAATQFSIVSDRTAPTVVITSDEKSPTNANPIPIKIDFSEAVTGFVIGDITISGGTLSNFSGNGAKYTVDVTPLVDGTITMDIAAGVAQDAAGNGNTAASPFSITYFVPSDNADLSNLDLNQGTINPPFSSGTISYTASVGNEVTSITVTPTVDHAEATVTVNGDIVDSGQSSDEISLDVGTNVIYVEVTAEDGTTTQTYSVIVTRAPSTNAEKGSEGDDSTEVDGPGESGTEDGSSEDQSTDSEAGTETGSEDDETLPDTATNNYYWVLLGIFTLMVGLILNIMNQRNATISRLTD